MSDIESNPPAEAPPLADDEKARLATLRQRVGAPDMTLDELREMQDLAMREYAAAPDWRSITWRTTTPTATTVGAVPRPDFHERLAAGINAPPDAMPPVPEAEQPQHAMLTHLFGAVEHLIGGFGHLAATVPQAAGLAPMIGAATQRLQSARAALMDAMAAYNDTRRGDLPGAVRDGEQAWRDGERAIESAPQPGTVADSGTVASDGSVAGDAAEHQQA